MTRPLRVLHVLNALRPSGAERMLAVAAPMFRDESISGEILSLATPAEGTFASELERAGYSVRYLAFRRRPRFFASLWRVLRRGSYDVVHVHPERASFWLLLLARASGTPRVVRTVHSTFGFSGALRLRRAAQRALLRRLGIAFVAVSNSVAETERAVFGNSAVVIPNWFDAERFVIAADVVALRARQELAVGHAPVVVTVGNCSETKNHGLLLRALAEYGARHAEAPAPVLVHVGAEDAKRSERGLAQQLGIAEQVRFLGARGDVAELLAAADVFAMSSRYEGFGIAALEAAAAGLRLVLTDAPGLRDLARVLPFATLSEASAVALAEALHVALSAGPLSRDDRHRQSDAARAAFSPAPGVRGYVAVYRLGHVGAGHA